MAKNSVSNLSTEEKKIYRMKKIDEVAGMFSSSNEGLTVKDVAVDLKLNSETARSYVRELFKRGLIYVDKTDGKTRIYKWASGEEKVTPEKEAAAFETEGKEFEPDEFISCSSFCKQGDVVYISSRSGDGAFFKYLIMTPWDRKATVVGIMDERSPRFDANDPNLIFIGNDPEEGVKLYADITNTCSRGYKQFGERCLHVDADKLEDVKSRVARTMHIQLGGHGEEQHIRDTLAKFQKASDIQKKELERSKELIKTMKQEMTSLKIQCGNKSEESLALMNERDTLTRQIAKLIDENKVLSMETSSLREDNKKLGVKCFNLSELLETTRGELIEAQNGKTVDPVIDISDKELELARLLVERDCLYDANSLLEKIVLKLIENR